MRKALLPVLWVSWIFTASLMSVAEGATVSNASIRYPDHSSLYIEFFATPGSYAQIKYGVNSGVYPYASESYKLRSGSCNTAGTSVTIYGWILNSRDLGAPIQVNGVNYTIVSGTGITATLSASAGTQSGVSCSEGRGDIAIGGLAPSTTYYFRVAARPNPDDDVNICQSDGCGSTELTFTTPAATHPVIPAEPSTVAPQVSSVPDTSGYTVIRMIRGSTGECVTAGAASGTNPTWNVAAGVPVQTVINGVGYGVVVEFDQGVQCDVPSGSGNQGYLLGLKPPDPLSSGLDDPAHRWIVFRTKTISATDFPPPGVRTGPLWAAKMANLQAKHPVVNYFAAAQHFGAENGAHHYRFENLELSVDTTVNTATSGPWQSYIQFGRNSNLTKYMVLDRVYIHGPGRPGRVTDAFVALGNHLAVVNSYIDQIECGGPQTSTPGHLETVDSTCFAFGIMFDQGGVTPQGPLLVDNNFVEAIGLGFYGEGHNSVGDTFSNDDLTFTHNHMIWPRKKMPGAPEWDGYSRVTRQQWEVKNGKRLRVEGNLIDGQWSYQNEGPAFFVSGGGVADVTIKNNLVRRAAVVFDCLGVRPSDNNGPPDREPARRVWFGNNLAYNLGRHSYTVAQGGGGLSSAYFQNRPGCQDLVITQNTLGYADGSGQAGSGIDYAPATMLVGGGATFSEGFMFTNNIYYFSVDNPPNYSGITSDETQKIPSHPRTPTLNTSGTFKQLLDSYAVTTTGTVQPNYVWRDNVVIGGKITQGGNTWRDLSKSEVISFSRQMPGTDIWVAGDTVTSRETAAGLSLSSFTTKATKQNPGTAGAQIGAIWSSLGVVQNIGKPNVMATSAQLTYLAPDARVCYAEISTDGISWTRTPDSGGSRSRKLLLSSLTPATPYQWRLLCYYLQQRDSLYYQDWSDDQITSGSFTTLPGGTSSIAVPFVLPRRASHVLVSLQPLAGSSAVTDCNASPCTVSGLAVGDYTIVERYLSPQGGLVAKSEPSTVQVR